ncbi:uncharacterized protein LOC142332515 [Lycorma delicatula]|uniref:uncharacterized protein LOC142332515 n=1 Tax=Lycorma delicatula TaxID=130591 RepID=UPI003F510E67
MGINNTPTKTNYSVDVQLFSTSNDFSANISCLMLPQITSNVPCNVINYKSWNLPSNLKLSDPEFYKPGNIDMLMGIELYFEIMKCDKRVRPGGFPVIFETELGWILSGEYPSENTSSSPETTCLTLTNDQLQQQLKQFWELEELVVLPKAKEQDECEQYYRNTTTRDFSGRLIVRLPLKPDRLPETHSIKQVCDFKR